MHETHGVCGELAHYGSESFNYDLADSYVNWDRWVANHAYTHT